MWATPPTSHKVLKQSLLGGGYEKKRQLRFTLRCKDAACPKSSQFINRDGADNDEADGDYDRRYKTFKDIKSVGTFLLSFSHLNRVNGQ